MTRRGDMVCKRKTLPLGKDPGLSCLILVYFSYVCLSLCPSPKKKKKIVFSIKID